MGMNYSQTIVDVMRVAHAARTAELTEAVSNETKMTVQSGPFAGMILPQESSWGNGDLLPKLLGTYEQELHPAIEKAISRNPELFVNIGCAEGYYAVGVARRLLAVDGSSFASDISEKARDACRSAFDLNKLNNFFIHDGNTVNRAHSQQPAFCLIDIEGGEKIYVQSYLHLLGKTDLIVECHDFIDPSITSTLVNRLEKTHDIELVMEGPRNPSGIPMLRALSSMDRWLCVNENRPSVMHWLCAWAKDRD